MSESPLTMLQRAQAQAIAVAAAPLIGGLCRTLTWTVEGAEHYDAIVESGRQPILACWHGRILTGLYYFRHRGIVALASQNFDGEWIARILRRFGYATVRGSTSRGGARALVRMRRELASGRPVVFTVDGPRGPARQAQAGAVWLAGATGHPILPFHLEADRAWTMSSWDSGQIPKPFTEVVVVLGEPLELSVRDPDAVVQGQLALGRALVELEQRCLGRLGADR